LAYQVIGGGPVDLLYLQGYFSQVDVNWESPHLSRFLEGLARRSRLIITDRRGWGCSDRFSPSDVPDVDTLTDDILTVLDAVGSSRTALLASWDSTILAAIFAATYPDRAAALILVDPMVNYCWTEETPWMPTGEQWDEIIDEQRRIGGTSAWTEPRVPPSPERDWFTRMARASRGRGRPGRRASPQSPRGHPRGGPRHPGPHADSLRPRRHVRGSPRDGSVPGRSDPRGAPCGALERRRPSSRALVRGVSASWRRWAGSWARSARGGLVRSGVGNSPVHRHRGLDREGQRAR
jgi:pimeloyl-ACP methyl ester carboxylesterase